MIAEAIISFRESLEAALLVGIILAYLEKTGNVKYNRHVYLGVMAGIIASAGVAMAFQTLAGGFEGAAENLFEGFLMLLAAALITWMIFWMMRQEQVRRDIEGTVDLSIGGRRVMGLAFFTFISVFREGVETVIFIAAAATTEKSFNALTGVFLGLCAAVLLAFVIFETTLKVDVKRFFSLTSLILIIFSAGVLAHAVQEFQEAGWLPRQEALWSTKGILDQESPLGGILRALLGYNDSPTPYESLVYFTYLGVALLAYAKSESRA